MAKEAKQWTLYALKLEGDKWYVDVTSGDPAIQLKRHKSGTGSAWTRRYKPVKLSYTKELGGISDDDAMKYAGKFLRKYMEHYGDGNVRGGDLPDHEQKTVTKKRRFSLWNGVTQAIVIIILLLIIGALLFDKFVLVPSTELVITQ